MSRKIKNQFVLVILAILLPSVLFSQEKDLRLNIGIPLGKYGKFDHYFDGVDASNAPSFIIQLEKQWKPDMSIGAYVGYAGQKHKSNLGFNESKFNYYRFGAVFTYELNNWLYDMSIEPGNGIEMYASVKTGLSLETTKLSVSKLDNGNTPFISTNKKNDLLIDLGVVLGARYHLSNQFGLFTELGWANAGFFTVGTTFSL